MKILKPLELAYQRVAATRRALYRSGRLRAERLPRPVISVGNLAFGGTGKTPATVAIARLLQRQGLSVTILSRGHGRRAREIAMIDSDDTRRFGDEPVMMRRALGASIPIVVGADRAAAGRLFLASSDCQAFLLDDGFQHLRLHRDCDIVIVALDEALRREPLSSLRDADVILARDGANVPEEWARGALVVGATLRPHAVTLGASTFPLEYLAGRRFVVFSGLADNEQFFSTLSSLGGEIVESRGFRDHHDYSADDLAELRSVASERKAILMTTAKDWVKIAAMDVAVLETEMHFSDPDTLLQRLVRHAGIDLP